MDFGVDVLVGVVKGVIGALEDAKVARKRSVELQNVLRACIATLETNKRELMAEDAHDQKTSERITNAVAEFDKCIKATQKVVEDVTSLFEQRGAVAAAKKLFRAGDCRDSISSQTKLVQGAHNTFMNTMNNEISIEVRRKIGAVASGSTQAPSKIPSTPNWSHQVAKVAFAETKTLEAPPPAAPVPADDLDDQELIYLRSLAEEASLPQDVTDGCIEMQRLSDSFDSSLTSQQQALEMDRALLSRLEEVKYSLNNLLEIDKKLKAHRDLEAKLKTSKEGYEKWRAAFPSANPPAALQTEHAKPIAPAQRLSRTQQLLANARASVSATNDQVYKLGAVPQETAIKDLEEKVASGSQAHLLNQQLEREEREKLSEVTQRLKGQLQEDSLNAFVQTASLIEKLNEKEIDLSLLDARLEAAVQEVQHARTTHSEEVFRLTSARLQACIMATQRAKEGLENHKSTLEEIAETLGANLDITALVLEQVNQCVVTQAHMSAQLSGLNARPA